MLIVFIESNKNNNNNKDNDLENAIYLAKQILPETKSFGFYLALEGLYNDSPEIRRIIENRLIARGSLPLPMVEEPISETILSQIRDYLEQFYPTGLPLFVELEKGDKKTLPMLRRKISPGISLRFAPLMLLIQKMLDQTNLSYVNNYAAPNGQSAAVSALNKLEGILVGDINAYPKDGVYVTAGGGTNGIYSVLEFLEKECSKSSSICCGPNYFQFFTFAKDKQSVEIVINEPENDSNNRNDVYTKTRRFLPTPRQISFRIRKDTKAIIITQPNNPTGESYSKDELREILELSKKYNLLVIADDAFEELSWDSKYVPVSRVAFENGCLDRVITIKSFSKGKNMPGERLGYLVSSNRQFLDFAKYNLLSQRDCPSNLNAGIICLDSVLRAAEYLVREKDYSLSAATDLAKNIFALSLPTIDMPVNSELVKIYCQQRREDQRAYQQNFDSAIRFGINSGIVSGVSDCDSAYNCLIKINGIPKEMSYFELAVNLFLNYGLETQWGANFDNNYSRWDKDYGVWMRLTFSSDGKYLIDGLERIQQGLDLFKTDSYPLFKTDLFKIRGN